MTKRILVLALFSASAAVSSAQSTAFLSQLELLPAPKYSGTILKPGDRLAICGDSITEQKMYSRIMEDYLTMCVPELGVTVRQYGWSGERAGGFLARMTNDCLRFKPTVATTCYGMNDHEYRPYEERIGTTYREKSAAILESFKANGVRVIHGSPGPVGRMPSWVKSASGTVDDLNLSLSRLRNIGVQLAALENVRFADVYWPMIGAGFAGQHLYTTNFAIAGKDGVHPGWAGHAVMAYAFLRAMGVDGEIGAFTVDLKTGQMKATEGHQVVSGHAGTYEIRSSKYPFCACAPEGQAAAKYPDCTQNSALDSTIRSVLAITPFNEELNRLMLVVKGADSERNYQITWGPYAKVFGGARLSKGVNLAAEFPENPFSASFARVDAAVAAKQAYETKQVKQVFHGTEGKANMEAAVEKTEVEREPLARAIREAFSPVVHVLKIQAL
jgi:lysophospholipase L1-like esterase